jgi:hypothetical protein
MGIRKLLRPRNEQGTIAIFMIVVMVSTGLIMITAATVEQGLKSSRRGGDSANALQVADAGVNDAITAITTAGQSPFTRTGIVGTGTYAYTATQDPNNAAAWLIDVVGTDKTGVKRHVKALAAGQPLFASPMYVNTSFSTSAGAVLDSYESGFSLAGASGTYTDGGCTDHGILFFNPSATLTFPSTNGGGTSINNCSKNRFGNNWKYSMDGCVEYGGNFTLPSSAWGTAKCPDPADPNFPNRTKAIPDNFDPGGVSSPTKLAVTDPAQGACIDTLCKADPGTSPLTCDATHPLTAGHTYFYNQINLSKGCSITGVSASATPDWVAQYPVILYTSTLNVDTGTQKSINEPPVTGHGTLCGTTTNLSSWTYQDVNNNPAYYYCTGWVRSLNINVIDGGSVNIAGNNGRFWGTFRAPNASVTLNAPQIEFWGAMLAKNLSTSTQFSWHYDDTLSSMTTGKYTVSNWREEPL